jgi:nitrogen fixation protein FixH
MSAGNQVTRSGRGCKEVTGRTVLICLVAFFAVVAGANAVLIRAAVSTFGGVETGNAYQAGLAFSKEIAAAQAQDALHWQVKADVLAAEAATVVEIAAKDATGRPLSGFQVAALLAHPADKRSDKIVDMQEAEPGTFRGRVEKVTGQWDLVIELLRGEIRLFRSKSRLFLR